ncbi:MAG: polyphenol oxidase family protein [Candidatus Promineifilaceae bacterium]
MQRREKNGVPYYQFDCFPADKVQHAVLTRQGGVSLAPHDALNLSNSQADEASAVAENRRRAYGIFEQTQETLVHASLVHGNAVARVTSADNGNWIPAVDGLITNERGVGLTLNAADCGILFLYDPINHAIGLAHAGWQGAMANMTGTMVRRMSAEFGSDPAQMIAALGPCISVSHYEVDEPVISQVHSNFPKWTDRLLAYQEDDDGNCIGRPHFNLALANHIGLYEADCKNVTLPAFCTASRTDLFFSHRAEKGKTGRFGTMFILN